jgi:cyclic pyranopterin phosphate synthase
MALLRDKFGRAITDLRISITDRCNYKCVYCRTGNEGALYGDLPFADYLRMARVLVGMGVTKIRLTGGEPLLRKSVVEFVRNLAQLRSSNGNGGAEPLDIALTTNGHLLADLAPASHALPFPWTLLIQTASPASRACPTDTITCSPAFAPPAAPDCGR